MTYLVAVGHNGTASYGTVDPQPKCRGMRWGRRMLAGDGLEYEDGFRSAAWQYGYLTVAQMGTLLSQFGLGEGTPSAFVTVRTWRNSDRVFADYNATMLMPEIPDSGGYYDMTVYQNVEFRLVRLEEL